MLAQEHSQQWGQVSIAWLLEPPEPSELRTMKAP
jgi:hypothetical protein